MSDIQKVFIASAGMLTSVGADTVSTSAAIKADKSKIEESAFYTKRNKAMKLSSVPDDALADLNENIKASSNISALEKRLLRLAHPALEQVISDLPPDNEPVPLFLALPESVPGYTFDIKNEFLDYLIIQTGTQLNKQNSRILPRGRAAGIEAIEMVFRYFQATGKDYALIGGVDSCMDLMLLGHYDKDERVLAKDIMDGFVPGEAAGFLLLVSERVASSIAASQGKNALSAIYRPGLANEDGHRYSDQPYKGDGLSQAFQAALSNASQQITTTIFSSLNGENFGVKEYGVATTRNSKSFAEDVILKHPAD